MGEHSEVFVAFDTAKLKHAVAIAEAGRKGEIRFLGEIENRPATVERLIKKRAGADPQAFGERVKTNLYRLQFLGHRVEPYAALATG